MRNETAVVKTALVNVVLNAIPSIKAPVASKATTQTQSIKTIDAYRYLTDSWRHTQPFHHAHATWQTMKGNSFCSGESCNSALTWEVPHLADDSSKASPTSGSLSYRSNRTHRPNNHRDSWWFKTRKQEVSRTDCTCANFSLWAAQYDSALSRAARTWDAKRTGSTGNLVSGSQNSQAMEAGM